MVVINVAVANCQPQTIVIGRRGTYDTMQIAFDLSNLIDAYGNGVAVLAVKRSQDESAYPAVTTQADNTLTWTVSETDTAYVGAGECQLMWYVDGGLAKTIIYPMAVMRDILATSEEAPDAYQTWVDDLTALGAETLQNAQNAAQSASDAESAKDEAITAKEAAESAKEAAETAVTHYPKIENNYWMVWDVDSQSYVSTGIQAEGEDGYSPEISITTITGGHRVTITDKDHPQGQSFDVLDGQGGGGTSDYTDLTNKPQINGHTLTGNQSAADLGLGTYSKPSGGIPKTDLAQGVQQSLNKADSALQTAPVQSVAGKTGAVNLGAGDVGFDGQETYEEGSVGAELQEQNRHLSDLEDSISDAYDATASYAIGAFCINENTLYRCNTAIPTGGEAWTPAHWDAVQIVDLLGAGGGDVTDVQINGTSILSDGVANIPMASSSAYGAVKAENQYGLDATPSGLRVYSADLPAIKAGTGSGTLYRPIVPYYQHAAAFYGLAKAAGDTTQSASSNPVGTYTDEAKAAIQSMLGVNNKMELIKIVTLDSDAQSVVIDTDDSSESFNLGSFVVLIKSVGASDATAEGYLKIALNSNDHITHRIADILAGIRKSGSTTGIAVAAHCFDGFGSFGNITKQDVNPVINSDGSFSEINQAAIGSFVSPVQSITSIFVGTDNANAKLGAGSVIVIYGVRK